MRRLIVIAVALGICSSHLQAQSSETGHSPPFVRLSASPAVLLLTTVEDGIGGAVWEFENATQLRATIERDLTELSSLGLTIGYAPISFSYSRYKSDFTTPSCIVRCQAKGDMWSASATFRYVSGPGLHHVMELNAGINSYSNLRESQGGARLAPLDGDKDLSFTGGYGVGWSPIRAFQIELIGDVGFAVHGRAGVEADRTQMSWLAIGRLVVRSGIGF